MPELDQKRSRFLFTALIAALLIFKWHDLSLPYFWDELGVYSQSSYYQYHHGISLMPASVPAEFSRGHPLLYTAMAAGWIHILGSSVFTLHLYCLLISGLLLFAVYSKTAKYFGPTAGLISSFILCIQPLFLAQSGLVLPEIILTLFIFLALCSYYEGRFVRFALWASLAILTKEAAIILPVTVLAYSLIRWALTRMRPESLDIKAISITLIPYVVFGIFLLIQKHQNGWYFFPLHIGSVSFAYRDVIDGLYLYLLFIFRFQGRYLLSVVLVIGLTVSILSDRLTISRTGNSFLLLLILSGCAFLGFNSLFGIYMDRYATAALVPLAILAGVSLTSVIRNKWLLIPTMIILLLVVSKHYDDGSFHYDADLDYRRQVHILQQAVDYTMEKIRPGEKAYGNFPAYYALTFPESGYIKNIHSDVSSPDIDHAQYLLLCEPGAEFIYDHSKFQFTELQKFKDEENQVTVYRVNKN